MAHIDIVGLGPGDPGLLTLKTLELLKNKTPNYFRTRIHPTLDFINQENISYQSFDQFYEAENNFEKVYQKIVEVLINSAQKAGKIVYAVPGNPLFGEATVIKLIEQAKQKEVSYRLHSGLSFVDVSMNALEQDPIEGLIIDDVFSFSALSLDHQKGSLITQVYNQHRASELKLELMKVLPAEKEVVLLINAGIPECQLIVRIPLFELDRVTEINHLTSLYIPPEKSSYSGLLGTYQIMKKLRSESGCPWDRAQNHDSLKSYLIEESYEVLEAIDQEDDENLCEELGDVFFQIMFHAVLGEEAGQFNISDVLKAINEKMIRRHPHVFKESSKITAAQVELNWQAIKRQEKGLLEEDETFVTSSQMKKIPKVLPALMVAEKVQKKAAKVGFDWENPQAASLKLEEEIKEIMVAINEKNLQNIEEELGDLLFSVVNVIRLYGFFAETTLRRATQKFVDRFETMELLASQEKKTIKESSFSQLDCLWERSKETIRQENR